jgi:hypothetical protein
MPGADEVIIDHYNRRTPFAAVHDNESVCGHEAADHILICDGRFRGEADIHDHVASTASAVDDPKADMGLK